MDSSEGLQDALARIAARYDEGDTDGAEKLLRQARLHHPEDLDIVEWEAVIALDRGRFAEARDLFASVVARDPGRVDAALDHLEALFNLARFQEVLDRLEELEPHLRGAIDLSDRAWVHHTKGACLDRLGMVSQADAEFKEAARLDGKRFPRPPRISEDEFDRLVEEAAASLPPRFAPYLRQVAISVRDYPPPSAEDPFLLGLYEGFPRTERSQESRDNLDYVTIYKRNLELEFPRIADLTEEIQKTIVHEVGHHFGLAEDEMGQYA